MSKINKLEQHKAATKSELPKDQQTLTNKEKEMLYEYAGVKKQIDAAAKKQRRYKSVPRNTTATADLSRMSGLVLSGGSSIVNKRKSCGRSIFNFSPRRVMKTLTDHLLSSQ